MKLHAIVLACLAGVGFAVQAADTAKSNQAVATPDCDDNVEYCPSPDQIRVDRSFSAIAIDSTIASAGIELTAQQRKDCEQNGECSWIDENKVRHHIWSDSPEDQTIVIKYLNAADFVGRPISALGIGNARTKAEVLANVRKFLPDVKMDCDTVSGNVGPVECGATVNPGWFQIGFDRQGNLLAIRFDGYHFI